MANFTLERAVALGAYLFINLIQDEEKEPSGDPDHVSQCMAFYTCIMADAFKISHQQASILIADSVADPDTVEEAQAYADAMQLIRDTDNQKKN